MTPENSTNLCFRSRIASDGCRPSCRRYIRPLDIACQLGQGCSVVPVPVVLLAPLEQLVKNETGMAMKLTFGVELAAFLYQGGLYYMIGQSQS